MVASWKGGSKGTGEEGEGEYEADFQLQGKWATRTCVQHREC